MKSASATTTMATTTKTMRLLSLVLFLLVISVAIEANTLFFKAKDNKICPDGKESCPDGTTCCLLSDGKYGCCPYPDAVCCSDHEHCCPSGFTCDVPDQKCVKKDGESIGWTKKLEVVSLRKDSNRVICPDLQSYCEDGQTCCLLVSGQWGCCPYPAAVCCSDHAHCCPNGYTCDVASQQCVKQNGESVPWSRKTKSLQISGRKSSDNTCPDQSQCEDGQTCCELESGGYGCCPYPQAACCSDKEHCCPNGYTCDVPHQKCVQKYGESISWSPKLKTNQVKKSNDITCPDQSQCDDGQTCCELASGGYGCCPYPQAACCSDKEHCCPNGYTCDVPHQQCVKGNGDVLVWSSTAKSSHISKIPGSVLCPDGSSLCPDGQTCCQLASGIWACCPMPQAVCCIDHEHCCPHGTTCDLAQQRCVQGNGESMSWSLKTKANQIGNLREIKTKEEQRESVVCPDRSTCSPEETCCLISPSHYGCCPLPRATCCTDYLHCCPNGYSCDLEKETCIKGNGEEIPWTRKSPPKSRPVEKSGCADQKSKCRDGYTCCSRSGTEVHGCCPYENAVCCSDGAHCCPENTVCDVETQMCRSTTNSMAISWRVLERGLIGARAGFDSVKKMSEKCPDHKSECPSETTCCQMQSGLYGCCRFKDALCCEDKLHCCPAGFKCDAEHSRCVVENSGIALPWEMFGRKRAKITP